MPDDDLSSVSFVTPFFLLGLTTIAVLFRIGSKLVAARAFDWEDGKLTCNFLLLL